MNAKPSAELRPTKPGEVAQDDEAEIGISYKQMRDLTKYRNDRLCGPFSMFDNLSEYWPDMELNALNEMVRKFFRMYSINRHKTIVATPSIYMSKSSVDAGKFDFRPFIYCGFTYQFEKIEKLKNTMILCIQRQNIKMNQQI